MQAVPRNLVYKLFKMLSLSNILKLNSISSGATGLILALFTKTIARIFGVGQFQHDQTYLAAKTEREGISFQQIANEVRKDLAVCYCHPATIR